MSARSPPVSWSGEMRRAFAFWVFFAPADKPFSLWERMLCEVIP